MSDSRIAIVFTVAASCALACFTPTLAQDDNSTPKVSEPCLFPKDCMRHRSTGRTNIGWGKCESSSGWRERYIHTTRDEAVRMWDERGKPFNTRIFDAYELTEEQRKSCDAVREDCFASWRRDMGDRYGEYRALSVQMLDRVREHFNAVRDAQEGDPSAMERLPNFHDDPVMQDLDSRLDELKRDFPLDWGELADKIEDVLPPEQAKRGRARLAGRFPFTISSAHGLKLSLKASAPSTANNMTDGTTNGAAKSTADDVANNPIDRWRAYVRAFKKRYELAPGQLTAVASILKEIREQHARLATAMANDVKHLEANENAESALRRHEVFQFGVEDLFEVFKTRLIPC